MIFVVVLLLGVLREVWGQGLTSECIEGVDQLIDGCPQLPELEVLREGFFSRSQADDENAFPESCCVAINSLNEQRCFCEEGLTGAFDEATGDEEYLPSLLFQASQLTPAGCSIPVLASFGGEPCSPFGNTNFPQETGEEEQVCTDNLISDVILKEANLAFLQEAIDLLAFDQQIDAATEITIFAPTDEAFENWATSQDLTVVDLLSDESQLEALLSMHILLNFIATPDTVTAEGVVRPSLADSAVTIALEGSELIRVQGIPTQQPASVACNGVLYIVDQVLDGSEVVPDRVVVEQDTEEEEEEGEPAVSIPVSIPEPEEEPAAQVQEPAKAAVDVTQPANQVLEENDDDEEEEQEVVAEQQEEEEETSSTAALAIPIREPESEIILIPVPSRGIVEEVVEEPSSAIVDEVAEEPSLAVLEEPAYTNVLEEDSSSLPTEVDAATKVAIAQFENFDPTAPRQPACEENLYNIMSRFIPLFGDFLNIISEEGLREIIQSEEALTILAPVNTAFTTDTGESAARLEEWNPFNQIVKGSFSQADLAANDSIATVNGIIDVSTTPSGNLLLGGAEMIQADIVACNGNLHVMGDLIIIDPTLQVPTTIKPLPAQDAVSEVVMEPEPEAEPAPSPLPSPSSDPIPSPLPSPSLEPSPTPDSSLEPAPSPGPSLEPSPLPSPIPSPEPSPTPSPSPEPSPIPSPISIPSPKLSPTSTPTPSPLPEPSPVPSPVPSPISSPTAIPTAQDVPPCTCSEDGNSGDVATGRSGCAVHVPDWAPFCYVTDPSGCILSRPSDLYPGARWRNCTLSQEVIEEMGAVSSISTEDPDFKAPIVNACDCSEDGISGSVETGREGCKNHVEGVPKFCYVVDPERCETDSESTRFPGAGYRSCTESTVSGSKSLSASLVPMMNEATGESGFGFIFVSQDS